MWLKAPNISCAHGFSTRHGGISLAPFDSLNLGGRDDKPENIQRNRNLALQALNINPDIVYNLKQIHGVNVCNALKLQEEGDALVTNEYNKCLAVSIADCYPILFYDEKNKVIAAAHAGWRGTVNRIAEHTLKAMKKIGAESGSIKIAIGQGISTTKFEVGDEVINEFAAKGFDKKFLEGNKVNLIACNKSVLMNNGVPENNIWVMNRCTYESDFFSYRRDNGLTGRMWAVICMKD
jgi:polyphenol oxidase